MEVLRSGKYKTTGNGHLQPIQEVEESHVRERNETLGS